MKFELVEPAEPTIADTTSFPPPTGESSEQADPAAGLAAVTERLTAEAAIEADRIDASLGEMMAALATPSTPGGSAEVRLPDNFRPDRFGLGRR